MHARPLRPASHNQDANRPWWDASPVSERPASYVTSPQGWGDSGPNPEMVSGLICRSPARDSLLGQCTMTLNMRLSPVFYGAVVVRTLASTPRVAYSSWQYLGRVLGQPARPRRPCLPTWDSKPQRSTTKLVIHLMLCNFRLNVTRSKPSRSGEMPASSIRPATIEGEPAACIVDVTAGDFSGRSCLNAGIVLRS